MVNIEYYTQKNSFQKRRWSKFFFGQTNAEPVNHQQICNKINVIGDCLGTRKMTSDGNFHLLIQRLEDHQK